MEPVWSPPASAETIAAGWRRHGDGHFLGRSCSERDDDDTSGARAPVGPTAKPSAHRAHCWPRPLSEASQRLMVVWRPTRTILVTSRKARFVCYGPDRARKGRTQGCSDVQRVELAQPSVAYATKRFDTEQTF